MRVFISWSGAASKAMALGLHKFIQQVLGRADPWMSEQDIAVGTRWPEALREGLVTSGYCVICVTRENVEKPWLNYEAGVIRDGLNKPTAPWMLDITPADFPTLPLNPLQGRACSKEGTLALIRSINTAMADLGRSGAIVEDLFEKCWPELEVELKAAEALLQAPRAAQRGDNEVLKELLTNTRAILDQLAAAPTISALDMDMALHDYLRTRSEVRARRVVRDHETSRKRREQEIVELIEVDLIHSGSRTFEELAERVRKNTKYDVTGEEIWELATRYPLFDVRQGKVGFADERRGSGAATRLPGSTD